MEKTEQKGADMQEIFEKIRERVKELGWVFAEYYPDGTEVHKQSRISVAYDDVIEIVNQVAEEYGKDINVRTNDGWIPCSERLPEAYTEVLGYGQEGYTYIVTLYDSKIYGKVWQQWNGGDMRLSWIIAWQPLPKQYRQKGV